MAFGTPNLNLIEKLEIRYRQFEVSARLPKRLSRRASAPLLVYPHHRWESSKVKLLVVGQETLRWEYEPEDDASSAGAIRTFKDFSCAADGVASMWSLYRSYDLGRRYPKMNSPFWRGFRELDAALNPEVDSALWTNVFKINVNGSVLRNCTVAEVAKIQKAQHGLLRHEIEILNPDVAVFFTGPSYDPAIRAEFPDLEFHAFEWPGQNALPLSNLAILRSSGLPFKTVRSYHPEYLQRSRQLDLISVISEWARSAT